MGLIEDRSGFASAAFAADDEQGRPTVTVVLKATYAITADGRVALAAEQAPVDLAGRWSGEPGASSLLVECEAMPPKPATDVALFGHAHAATSGATVASVALGIGALARTIRVTGDRCFVKGWFGIGISDPVPFERIPLRWEHAFGGWDRSAAEESQHTFEPRNPAGRGFRTRKAAFVEGVLLPNLEDPADPVRAWGRPVAPAGFGFLAPGWQPRVRLAGTFDERWREERAPLLPADHDPRFANAAAPGLVADGHLRGDEAVLVRGARPDGDLAFRLPAQPPPAVRLVRRTDADLAGPTVLDTVVIDADARRLTLVWRARFALADGLDEVAAIITAAEAPALAAAAG